MFVQVPTHTVLAVLVGGHGLEDVEAACRSRSEMSLTVAVGRDLVAGDDRGPHSNSWPPWTISAKLIPISGSKIAGPIAGAL